MTDETPAALADEAGRAYERREYDRAADLFQRAGQILAEAGDSLLAAEMNNNRSVSLLQAGKAKDALQAALGTDQVFAAAADTRRQAMALGNQAAALEALHRLDEALAAYERSAALFEQAGEGDLRAMVLKSAAAIKMRSGAVTEAAFKMIGSLEAKNTPSFFDRIMKFLLRSARK